MGGPAVGFDDQVVLWPVEVDFGAVEERVDQRLREAGVVDECEEELLEVVAGDLGVLGGEFGGGLAQAAGTAAR